MEVNCYKYINLEYLEMMSDGDDSMKKVMLEMLLEELPLEIKKMDSLCQEGSWDEVSSVSHKLKSTLAFVGNEEMTNANTNIEGLSKEANNVGQVPKLIETLQSLCPSTISELNLELEKL